MPWEFSSEIGRTEIGRRTAIRIGFGALASAPMLASAAHAQVLDEDESRKLLFAAANLGGGGQLEVRMTLSAERPDPDIPQRRPPHEAVQPGKLVRRVDASGGEKREGGAAL